MWSTKVKLGKIEFEKKHEIDQIEGPSSRDWKKNARRTSFPMSGTTR